MVSKLIKLGLHCPPLVSWSTPSNIPNGEALAEIDLLESISLIYRKNTIGSWDAEAFDHLDAGLADPLVAQPPQSALQFR
jgi:hypothetical protein